MEVAQIAKSIAIKLNHDIRKVTNDEKFLLDLDLIEFAALAHDIGHPPFGHQGEEALDECMINHGGFEGNAQTLRILTRLEKREVNKKFKDSYGFDIDTGRDERLGLNLTYRTLASVLKYDRRIPVKEYERQTLHRELRQKGKAEGRKPTPVKGYYDSESEIVDEIKQFISREKWDTYRDERAKRGLNVQFKTIECKIMDIADDIAYSTYDLEDGFKAGFYTPMDLLHIDDDIITKVVKKVAKNLGDLIDSEGHILLVGINEPFNNDTVRNVLNGVFEHVLTKAKDEKVRIAKTLAESHQSSKDMCDNGFARTWFTSSLVNRYIQSISLDMSDPIPAFWEVKMENEARVQIEILKRLTYVYQINSPKLKIAEFRGKDIVKQVFKALEKGNGHELLPLDFRELYELMPSGRKRLLCDFIAGMTDRYLIEFYSRLYSEDPETIFKPI